jgi:hypothetical protein
MPAPTANPAANPRPRRAPPLEDEGTELTDLHAMRSERHVLPAALERQSEDEDRGCDHQQRVERVEVHQAVHVEGQGRLVLIQGGPPCVVDRIPPARACAESSRGACQVAGCPREKEVGVAGARRRWPATGVPRPPIRQWPIPFPARRKQEMAAYSQGHYGRRTYRLTTGLWVFASIPMVIVLGTISCYGGPSGRGNGTTTVAIAGTGVLLVPPVLMILFHEKYPRWWFNWNSSFSGSTASPYMWP